MKIDGSHVPEDVAKREGLSRGILEVKYGTCSPQQAKRMIDSALEGLAPEDTPADLEVPFDNHLRLAIEKLSEEGLSRVVSIDLPPSKQYIYFDRDPETGKWRMVYTKPTLTEAK